MARKKRKRASRNGRTNREQIAKEAVKVLRRHPDGLRFTVLAQKLRDKLPHIPPATIGAGIGYHLPPEQVYKPARGVYRLTEFEAGGSVEVKKQRKVQERDFYDAFAMWLQAEMDECTKAVPLGGKALKDKWGTPDVIGIRKLGRRAIIEAPAEVVSAEVKLDSSQLITAFGQACAYLLFSHKCYLAVPKDSSQEDISRLDALCLMFGIGLVLFDAEKPDDPAFEIRTRAARHEPDMFYLDKTMTLLDEKGVTLLG